MKYRMDDNGIVDTNKAKACYHEDTTWNGNNWISANTGSQWEHETLYKSSKGRWYLVERSDWQGTTPSAHYLAPSDAAAWLVLNNKELPQSLAQYADEVCA